MKSWALWTIFGASWICTLGALGWVSTMALSADRAETDARRRADQEEAVRLALWRMDSSLTPLMTQENSRRYFVYSSFYAPERAYTRMLEELSPKEIWVPSPILHLKSAVEVFVHFQVDAAGRWTSPQVPASNERDVAESKGYTTGESIEVAQRYLTTLAKSVTIAQMLERIPEVEPESFLPVMPQSQLSGLDNFSERNPLLNSNRAWVDTTQSRAPRGGYREQGTRNTVEYGARQLVQANVLSCGINENGFFACEDFFEGTLCPFWVDDFLLLARRVRVKGVEYVQGCWLNWDAVKSQLLTQTEGLLPEASLLPIPNETERGDRSLAMLPVRLNTGQIASEALGSEVQFAVIVTWACALLAATALSFLLVGAVSLSERRRRFVSAVTHELRTPLTTFRMYTEMLKEGMVPDPVKREGYLTKLHGESERLHHLVENVLSYARLEGNTRPTLERISLQQLQSHLGSRLSDRAAECAHRVVLAFESDVELEGDLGAIDRILFNLIDNACKYAPDAPELRVEGKRQGSRVEISVTDGGPGIPEARRTQLFNAFRSRGDAGTTGQPGVGLGLSLSRRLARAMHGDLQLDTDHVDGARFVLTLRGA